MVRRQANRERERLGRSRGGLSRKTHLLADARCRPVAAGTSPGQREDTLAYSPLMTALQITRRGPGRPRTRSDRLLGDEAYSSDQLLAVLRRCRIPATFPVPDGQATYRPRNTVERAFNKLESHRAFATGTDKRAYVHTGTTAVAVIRIWLRDLTRQEPKDTP